MRSALERRQEILEALSDRRFETVQNLATEFDVSVRTIVSTLWDTILSLVGFLAR